MDVVVVSANESVEDNDEEDEQHVGNEFYRKVIQLNAARYASCSNRYVVLVCLASIARSLDRTFTRSLTHARSLSDPSLFRLPATKKALSCGASWAASRGTGRGS